MIGVAQHAGTTTCIGVVIALGSVVGAGSPVTPTFVLGIGIANAATSICNGGHTATAASVVGDAQMAGSSSPLVPKQRHWGVLFITAVQVFAVRFIVRV